MVVCARSWALILGATVLGLSACAEVSVPNARKAMIPTPVSAEQRKEAVNERPDSVMYLPLGEDVLVPLSMAGDRLPSDRVGPFELRDETLAGALQLILADYDVSIAFETEEGLTRKVTVTNLQGDLDKVVNRVCSLADLYCSYEDETVIVKDTQTFTVTLPPLADSEGGSEFISDVIQGLTAVIGDSGTAPVSDPTTRALIYSATQRTSRLAENYFQRLRANTAMVVFETYIWEVSLDSGNSTGIDWDKIEDFGRFNTSIDFNGSVGGGFLDPVSIGLPTTQAIGATPTDVIDFLSQFGAVKTISQPQITVLSGSSAELRVADTENFVSEVSSTISGDQTTTSVSTDTVDSGFTLAIGSSWDQATVYANININLTNVDDIENFTFSDSGDTGTDTIIQLPQTTERELTTQIRIRPGDSVLIAGLVRETDNFSSRGAGFMEPILPDSRTVTTDNLELVVMLRPRVIVYTDTEDQRYRDFVTEKRNMAEISRARRDALKAPAATVLEKPARSLLKQPKIETPKQVDVAPEVLPKISQKVSPESLPKISPALSKSSAPAPPPASIAPPQPVSVPTPIAPVVEKPTPLTAPIKPVQIDPVPVDSVPVDSARVDSVSAPAELITNKIVEPVANVAPPVLDVPVAKTALKPRVSVPVPASADKTYESNYVPGYLKPSTISKSDPVSAIKSSPLPPPVSALSKPIETTPIKTPIKTEESASSYMDLIEKYAPSTPQEGASDIIKNQGVNNVYESYERSQGAVSTK